MPLLLSEYRDGLRCEQRALELFDAADVRLWSTGAHHHGDQRAGEFDLGLGAYKSAVAKLVSGRAVQNHDVRDLASRQACRYGLRRVSDRGAARGDQPMAGGALERRAQLGIGAEVTSRDHDVDVGGRLGAREERHGRADREHASHAPSWFHEVPPAFPFRLMRSPHHMGWIPVILSARRALRE